MGIACLGFENLAIAPLLFGRFAALPQGVNVFSFARATHNTSLFARSDKTLAPAFAIPIHHTRERVKQKVTCLSRPPPKAL